MASFRFWIKKVISFVLSIGSYFVTAFVIYQLFHKFLPFLREGTTNLLSGLIALPVWVLGGYLFYRWNAARKHK
jgi:hypothetical protein